MDPLTSDCYMDVVLLSSQQLWFVHKTGPSTCCLEGGRLLGSHSSLKCHTQSMADGGRETQFSQWWSHWKVLKISVGKTFYLHRLEASVTTMTTLLGVGPHRQHRNPTQKSRSIALRGRKRGSRVYKGSQRASSSQDSKKENKATTI